MKNYFTVASLACLLGATMLSGCGNANQQELEKLRKENNELREKVEELENSTKTEPFQTKENDDRLILSKDDPKPVIYEDDNLSISVNKASLVSGDYEVEFFIDNRTNETISVQGTNGECDGYQISLYHSMSGSIAPGLKGLYRGCIINPKDLEEVGIKDWTKINCSFVVYGDSAKKIAVIPVTIEKNLFEQ